MVNMQINLFDYHSNEIMCESCFPYKIHTTNRFSTLPTHIFTHIDSRYPNATFIFIHPLRMKWSQYIDKHPSTDNIASIAKIYSISICSWKKKNSNNRIVNAVLHIYCGRMIFHSFEIFAYCCKSILNIYQTVHRHAARFQTGSIKSKLVNNIGHNLLDAIGSLPDFIIISNLICTIPLKKNWFFFPFSPRNTRTNKVFVGFLSDFCHVSHWTAIAQ